MGNKLQRGLKENSDKNLGEAASIVERKVARGYQKCVLVSGAKALEQSCQDFNLGS